MIVNRRHPLILVVALALLVVTTAAGSAQDDTAAETFISATVDALPAAPAVIELSRSTLAAGAGLEQVAPGPVLYGVESGTLGVRLDGGGVLTRSAVATAPARPEPAEPNIDYTLRPGDQLLVPDGVGYLLFNDGQEAASFFTAALFSASATVPSWLPSADLPAGISHRQIASDVADGSELPGGPVHVALQRIPVPAGAAFPPPPGGGLALIVPEDGALTVSGTGATERSLAAGEVLRITDAAPARARNDGAAPLTALVLTLGDPPTAKAIGQ